MRLKISARKSDLARLQAYLVGDALKKNYPSMQIEFRFKESLGDKNLTDPLWKIPEKGVFTEDFYGELQRGETDLVVHSWKDLPTETKSDTMIAATLPRADQRDLLLFKKDHLDVVARAKTLRIYSSSPRREYNLTDFFKNHFPYNIETVRFQSVRGNVPTRIRKLLEDHQIDGLIVAKAALDRLLGDKNGEFEETQNLLRSYLQKLNWMVLPLSVNPNAAAQGALAVEIMSHREDLKEILAKIHDPITYADSQNERKILASYGGGCHQKIGISILSRPYGEIQFLKGLTDQGIVLAKRSIKNPNPFPKFTNDELWVADFKPQRFQKNNYKINANIEALLISRSEAWPAELEFKGIVWTAGLKTWRALAQKGIWVHGTFDNLGEQESADIDTLFGGKIKWAKLTHEAGYFSASTNYELISTYKIEFPSHDAKIDGKKCFFWSSGSQFLYVVNQHPEIASNFHGCGPGNTFKVITEYLKNRNISCEDRVRIFLDQDDWRQQCTK